MKERLKRGIIRDCDLHIMDGCSWNKAAAESESQQGRAEFHALKLGHNGHIELWLLDMVDEFDAF